ncbi:MAG: hypothetical protein IJZ61_07015 [Oscillospiraceae bacterium]|nr:hypothetical protein [Oscillospiraceae bacterium]
MNFISVNEPESFIFHDGYLDKITFTESDMLWLVSYICVDKTNSRNYNECAMGIPNAEAFFKNYRIESATVDGVKITQEQWSDIISYCGESCTYFSDWNSVHSSDGVTVTAEFIFENGVVSLQIFCTEFTVSWDSFNVRAGHDKEKNDSLLKRVIRKITTKNED